MLIRNEIRIDRRNFLQAAAAGFTLHAQALATEFSNALILTVIQ